MTPGERYVAACLQYAGRVVERTGRNDGGQVEAWQREAERVYVKPAGTYRGAPWCAIGAGAVARESGIGIASPEMTSWLWHPYTGYITQQADRMGGLQPTGPRVLPGSLIVNPGIHVGVVVNDRGNGLLDTVEFNAGDAVSRLVRNRADWRVVEWPGVGTPTAPRRFVMSYGFDDLNVKPRRFGGWISESTRDQQIDALKATRPSWWTRRVRWDSAGSPYGFWGGAQGTWESDWAWWEYGGWTAGGDESAAKATRERQIDAFERAHGHRNVRVWARRVPVPVLGISDLSGTVSSDVKTT